MKKVLIVITTTFVPTGGLTSVMMNYYRNIDKAGLRIDFSSTNVAHKVLTDELILNGSKYVKLPNRKHFLQYFIALVKVFRSYDVAHVNGNSATAAIELLAARIAGVKVRIAHNHTTKTEHLFVHRLLLPFFRKSYTVGLACSEQAGNWLFGKGNFSVLNNAIDVDKYRYNEESRNRLRKELGISKNAFVIGHVGKYNTPKNHFKLIEVFYDYQKTHDNAFLLCVGYGPLKCQLENRIVELGIENKVILTGERTDIPELLSAMDFFVFPSIWEGLGLAVIEAQASGLPCLLSDHVPQDVYLSDHVESLSLEQKACVWSEKIDEMSIIERFLQSDLNVEYISKGGYNISVEANNLLKFYNVKKHE